MSKFMPSLQISNALFTSSFLSNEMRSSTRIKNNDFGFGLHLKKVAWKKMSDIRNKTNMPDYYRSILYYIQMITKNKMRVY